MVITKCCGIAIGSQCKAQHIAKFGECWNCGEEVVQREPASEAESKISWSAPDAESWVSHDLKDSVKKDPPLPTYASRLPANDADRQSATATVKGGSILPSGSTMGGSNTLSTSNVRESERPQTIQPLFGRLTEDQRIREPAMYQPQSARESSTDVRAAPQYSLNLMDGHTKNNGSVGKRFDEVIALRSIQRNFTYDGSESAVSDVSPNEQQHLRDLNKEEHKRQDAKEYVIGATKHLVEMCNAYGDEIDEADKDEVMNEILEAVGGKRPTCR